MKLDQKADEGINTVAPPTHSGRNGSVADSTDAASSPSTALPANVQRILLAVVLVAGFAELAYVVVNISAMPVYIKAIGLDARWIGIATTAYLVIEGVMKSPFGVLGDRIGRKTLIMVGPAISTVTALLTPFVHNPYGLVGLRFLDGLGAAALWPSAFSLIGDYVPEARRASAMSLFNVSYLLGIALGPALGGGINDWAHFHLHLSETSSKDASFYMAAVLFAITTLVAALVIPKVPRPSKPSPSKPEGEGGFNFADFARMLKSIPMALLMAFVTFLGIGLVTAYAKVFVMEQFHLSETRFGMLLIAPALIIAVASVPLGAVGDKIGKSRAVQLGIGICMAAYWTLFAFQNEVTLIVLGSLIGIGFVVAFPAWMALVSSQCEASQRGAAVGAVGTAQGIGAIVGAALSGILYKLPAFAIGPITVPEHGAPFLGCGIMLVCSFLLTLFTIRDAPRAQAA